MEIIAERERGGETEAFPSTKIKALACVLIDWTYLRAIACRAWGFLLRRRGPSDFSQRSAVNKQFREVSIYKCIPARKPKATPISVFSYYCVRNRLTSQFSVFCREKWNSWTDYNRNTACLSSLNPLHSLQTEQSLIAKLYQTAACQSAIIPPLFWALVILIEYCIIKFSEVLGVLSVRPKFDEI